MAAKKSRDVKKITEIENAKVTIEVEETEDKENVNTEVEGSIKPEPELREDIPLNEPQSDGFGFKKLILTILIIVPIGFLIFGGFLYFSKNFKFDQLRNEPEKKIVLPSSEPTPTKSEINKQAYEIEIQNGSGIAGEGARVSEILEKEGFKVGSVGNAPNSNYEETEITVNKEVPEDFVEALTEVLEERGAVAKEIEKFAEGEDGEVLIILGSDLNDTE
jgi:hypothetical protein